MRIAPIAGAIVAAIALSGCSQIAAIAPVGGNRLSDVRYAANDVLLDGGVELLISPVCTEAPDKTVTCEGSALGDETTSVIEVVSPGNQQDHMTITIAGAEFFEGSVQDVLDAAMRPAS